MKKLVKQLRNGQITIPKEFRDALGLTANDVLSIRLVDGKLELEAMKLQPKAPGGSPWASDLYALFRPVRDAVTTTDEEVNEAIDNAVEEVRTRQR